MDKPDVFMPLYIGDYLAGTSRLTTELHGAYMLLIMDYWMNGPLPDDDQVLASIVKMSRDAWSNARASLEHYFSIEQACWKHKRIEEELAAAYAKKRVAKQKAEVAAAARWGKKGKNGNKSLSTSSSNAPSNATSTTQAMLEECPSPSPSPSPSDNKLKVINNINAGELAEFEITRFVPTDQDMATCSDLELDSPLEQIVAEFRVHHRESGTVTTARNWSRLFRGWVKKRVLPPAAGGHCHD